MPKIEHCSRCGDQLLSNNRTNFGVCDNCWQEAVNKAQIQLAKEYKNKKEDKDE